MWTILAHSSLKNHSNCTRSFSSSFFQRCWMRLMSRLTQGHQFLHFKPLQCYSVCFGLLPYWNVLSLYFLGKGSRCLAAFINLKKTASACCWKAPQKYNNNTTISVFHCGHGVTWLMCSVRLSTTRTTLCLSQKFYFNQTTGLYFMSFVFADDSFFFINFPKSSFLCGSLKMVVP